MKFAAAIVLLFALASVASARPVGLRSLRYNHWENDHGEDHWEDDHGEEEKDPIYCTGAEHSKDECPEHYECALLEDTVCEDCVKDDYGNDNCTHNEHCWEYACIEIPKYCNVTYDGKDECVTKYGEKENLKCKSLEKEEEKCVDKEECKLVEVCKEYEYEDKCTYVDVCKPEKKCEGDKKECKTYKKDVCKEYKTVKGECKYEDVCKKEKVCEKVKKGCLIYEHKEECEDVEVCWTGKCVKVEAPKKEAHKKEAPKKEAPKKAGYTFGK